MFSNQHIILAIAGKRHSPRLAERMGRQVTGAARGQSHFRWRKNRDSPRECRSSAGVFMVVSDNDPNAGTTPTADVLGRLFDRYAASLALFARQWCHCPEDVVQEALIELAAQARMPDDPAAWLYRVVRNKAITALRSRQRRRRHETALADPFATLFKRSPADRSTPA